MRLILIMNILLLIGSLSCSNVNAQNVFYLKDVVENGEINYRGIENINEYNSDELLDSVFNVERGKYKIYRFIRESVPVKKDVIDDDSIHEELIVLKVSGNKIIDAYYCPLDWKEPPISSVLLKSKKKVKFGSTIKVSELLFEPYQPDGGVDILDETSVLSIEKAP